jgi:endonuclease YncB( thermonuclease family)
VGRKGLALIAGLLLPLWLGFISFAGLIAGFVVVAAPAAAAEVLQVTGPDRLVIGDRNRSTAVRLGCVAVEPQAAAEATALLRRLLPRRRRVNLRPMGVRDGELLARIRPIDPDGEDPAEALVAAGLAQPIPCA